MTIKISAINRALSDVELDRFTEIAGQYYPDTLPIRDRIETNIRQGAYILIAQQAGECIGFSLSSCERRATPFYSTKIPFIYQRQMYVDRNLLGKKVGVHLQIRVLRKHLGPFWLFRRFGLMSITHNPLIVKNFALYSRYYPNINEPSVPQDISHFAQELAKQVGGETIDDKLRVYGTYKSILNGEDYTWWWREYLASGNTDVDNFVLDSLFRTEEDKVIHSGLTFLMIGYATPMNFIKRFIEIKRNK